MIARLRGTIQRLSPGQILLDTQGVGYLVSVPVDVWEQLKENVTETLWIANYIREDRFDLFGFRDANDRILFEQLVAQSGIGPRVALELCGVPRHLLTQSVQEDDTGVLTALHGIGKKKAEKLLLELRSLIEKSPQLFTKSGQSAHHRHNLDQDALAALTNLGYDTSTALRALKSVPNGIGSTEERVTAALRAL